MYMSENIGEQYKDWGSRRGVFFERFIFLQGGTGCGKTEFILRKLVPFCAENDRSILFLFNRRSLKQQVDLSISNLSIQEQKVIDTTLYQTLCAYLRNEKYASYNKAYSMIVPAYESKAEIKADKYRPGRYLHEYDYIVFDEVHYFTQDASFNFDTYDLYLSLMRGIFDHQVYIFMSATMFHVKEALVEVVKENLNDIYNIDLQKREYPLPFDFSRMRASLYASDLEIVEKVRARLSDKWLIFVSSIDKGKKLKDTFKQSLPDTKCIFLYQGASSLSDNLDKMFAHGFFYEHQIVIATSIIDNGISIKDKDFRHIVIDNADLVEVVQMLGRKRFIDDDPDDLLNVYIRDYTPEQFVKIIRREKRRLQLIKDFDTTMNPMVPIAKYCNRKEMFNLIGGSVYFSHKGPVVNRLAAKKCNMLLHDYRKKGEVSWGDYVIAELGLPAQTDTKQVDTFRESIENVLADYYGVEMTKEEVRVLKNRLSVIISQVNNRSKHPIARVSSSNANCYINAWLLGYGINSIIYCVAKRGKKNIYSVKQIPDELVEQELASTLESINSKNYKRKTVEEADETSKTSEKNKGPVVRVIRVNVDEDIESEW